MPIKKKTGRGRVKGETGDEKKSLRERIELRKIKATKKSVFHVMRVRLARVLVRVGVMEISNLPFPLIM